MSPAKSKHVKAVVFVSTFWGVVGGELTFALLRFGTPGFRGLSMVPFSIITWLLLTEGKSPETVVAAVVEGLLSPIVGSLLSTPFSLLPLVLVGRFYYLFGTVGVLTGLTIRYFCYVRGRPRYDHAFCKACGYDIHAIGVICPECGRENSVVGREAIKGAKRPLTEPRA